MPRVCRVLLLPNIAFGSDSTDTEKKIDGVLEMIPRCFTWVAATEGYIIQSRQLGRHMNRFQEVSRYIDFGIRQIPAASRTGCARDVVGIDGDGSGVGM